ncbi:TRADD-N-associated membrane domain-containing protein [Lusitaniella coriacea]|uniref:TRADD-N-associated membrane domain-containing protein n=1 Tax=Lusitaniella coriacea TaxID=1983105 RepID=UPI003CFBAECA
MIKYQDQSCVVVVLNQRGEIVEIYFESNPSNRDRAQNIVKQEQLRQSRTKFNLACTLIALSAAFSFTGIGLFWLGHISKDTALQTVNLLAGIAKVSWRLMEGEKDFPETE